VGDRENSDSPESEAEEGRMGEGGREGAELKGELDPARESRSNAMVKRKTAVL
jgi:hypothetical protein